MDFCRGVDALMALVRDAGADRFNGALYVFRAKRAAVGAENVRMRAENAEVAALNRNADERIARLMSIIAMFERARYGKRSEKLPIDALSEEQYQFVFDEIDTVLAAISAELERADG